MLALLGRHAKHLSENWCTYCTEHSIPNIQKISSISNLTYSAPVQIWCKMITIQHMIIWSWFMCPITIQTPVVGDHILFTVSIFPAYQQIRELWDECRMWQGVGWFAGWTGWTGVSCPKSKQKDKMHKISQKFFILKNTRAPFVRYTVLFLFLKRNCQWPRWGLSWSVCIQLCSTGTPPSCLQLSLHIGVSHQSNSVLFVLVPSTWLWSQESR
jgi:hypothetical protein